MRKIYTLLVLLTLSAGLMAQTPQLTLRDTVQFLYIPNFLGDVGGSDCWGYTAPDGEEYAVMGTYNGIGFVRAADAQVIDELQGPRGGDGYYHRDIKSYKHYIYAVAEMFGTNAGIMIVDMQYLPDSVHFVQAYSDSLQTFSHNMSIDTAMGYAYVEAQGDTGIYVYSLADPENPTLAGFIPALNTHDMVAKNDTVWVAEGYSKAFSVWDLSDKNNPTIITRITDPGFGYCHNIWPSEDSRFFYTTEETPFKTVKCWEFISAGNIVQRGEYLAPCNLAHNVHVQGPYVWLSHYESGIRCVDWSDPDNPIEITYFDTFTQDDTTEFRGNWGVYPHTANGMVFASDFNGKLSIFDFGIPSATPAPAPAVSLIEYGPNPTQGAVNFSTHQPEKINRLQVYDITGRIVLTLDNPLMHNEMRWDGRDARGNSVEAGMYFFHFSGPDYAEVIRINRQ